MMSHGSRGIPRLRADGVVPPHSPGQKNQSCRFADRSTRWNSCKMEASVWRETAMRNGQRANVRRRTKRSHRELTLGTARIPARSDRRETRVSTQVLPSRTVLTQLSASPNRVNPKNPNPPAPRPYIERSGIGLIGRRLQSTGHPRETGHPRKVVTRGNRSER